MDKVENTARQRLSAGYVVCSNEGIHGIGATADDAWSDFEGGLWEVAIVTQGDDTPEDCNRVRKSDYKICPATAALLDLLEERGGDVAWVIVRGIACTVGEAERLTRGHDFT